MTTVERVPSNRSILREKKSPKKTSSSRRISCKDLGNGDCEGWLQKKKEATGRLRGGTWTKLWFVLKQKSLYYFKAQEDLQAAGVLSLQGFMICPASEKTIKDKRYAFKAVHDKHGTFYFASDRFKDMEKWMNKLGLASLDTSFNELDDCCPLGHISESDEEPDSISNCSSSIHSPCDDRLHGSPLEDALNRNGEPDHVSNTDTESIAKSDTNSDSNQDDLHNLPDICPISTLLRGMTLESRTSRLKGSLKKLENMAVDLTRENKLLNIACLQRQIKDKERELLVIDDFLAAPIITSDVLQKFRSENPLLVMLVERLTRENTSEEQSTSSDRYSESPPVSSSSDHWDQLQLTILQAIQSMETHTSETAEMESCDGQLLDLSEQTEVMVMASILDNCE